MQRKHYPLPEGTGESSLRRIKYQMCENAEDLASLQAEVGVYVKFFARQGLKCTLLILKREARSEARFSAAGLPLAFAPYPVVFANFVNGAYCLTCCRLHFLVDNMVARITLVRLAQLCRNTALKFRCPICHVPLHFDKNLEQHFVVRHSQAPVPAVVRLHSFMCSASDKRRSFPLIFLEKVMSGGTSGDAARAVTGGRRGSAASPAPVAVKHRPLSGRHAYTQAQLDHHMDERLPACANRDNPYHLCSSFCDLRYDAGRLLGYVAPEMVEVESLKMLKLQMDVEDDAAIRRQLRFRVCFQVERRGRV